MTGGAQGIGRAISEVFAREGATVIVGDLRTPDASERLAGVEYRTLDVASEQAWDETVSAIVRAHGRLDILVNNAGVVVTYERIHKVAMADYDKVIAVTQTGAFLGIRAVVPAMRTAGGGSIVNMSSVLGVVGSGGGTAYQVAKGAVRIMTKTAAVSYAHQNIRVNSVHPALVATPMTQSQDESRNAWTLDRTPMGRACRPEEVAMACLFLASDEASYITGVELPVDGGYLAQ